MSINRDDPNVPDSDAGGILHIDLDALANNWRSLRAAAGGAETAAVVKANAYGIGIERAVPALARAGCETFFVAHIGEAIRARAVAPDATIYVLNGLLPGSSETYFATPAPSCPRVAGGCRRMGGLLPRAIATTRSRDPCGYGHEPSRIERR